MEKSADAFRTITEVADLLETPAHVLRFWESRFPQIKPVKRAGGRRYYRPSDVALLTGIKRLLHDEGMTIRGVQKILREQGVRHVAGVAEDPSPEEEALEAALMARLDREEGIRRPAADMTADMSAELALGAEAGLPAPAAVVLPFRPPEAGEADAAANAGGSAGPEAEGGQDLPQEKGPVPPPPPLAAGPASIGSAAEAEAETAVTGPDLTLASIFEAARGPDHNSAPESLPESLPDPAPAEAPVPEVLPPLANRLRALPRNALAPQRDSARAALARLTALRNRLASAASPRRD